MELIWLRMNKPLSSIKTVQISKGFKPAQELRESKLHLEKQKQIIHNLPYITIVTTDNPLNFFHVFEF